MPIFQCRNTFFSDDNLKINSAAILHFNDLLAYVYFHGAKDYEAARQVRVQATQPEGKVPKCWMQRPR